MISCSRLVFLGVLSFLSFRTKAIQAEEKLICSNSHEIQQEEGCSHYDQPLDNFENDYLETIVASQLLAVQTEIVSPGGNLALGRPATQSSTYDDYAHSGLLSASRAVDGNYSNDRRMTTLSCSHTNDDRGGPNWWRVQLDRPYRVQKVIVTNRKDCCAENLDHFIVGVTNSTAVPVRETYPLCGQYPLEVEHGATVTLDCNPDISAGQYVIIQQPSNGTGWLTLCEVEVYARTERNWCN